jgi:hypothetical protein
MSKPSSASLNIDLPGAKRPVSENELERAALGISRTGLRKRPKTFAPEVDGKDGEEDTFRYLRILQLHCH